MDTTNKLFRVTRQRLSILDGIVRSVRSKVEMNDSFIEHTVPLIPDPDRRLASKEEHEAENKKLKLYHDVLHTVTFHNNDWHLSNFRYGDSDWRTEWDIPEVLFKEAIEYLIELMKIYQSYAGKPSVHKYHQKQIDILNILIEFRTKRDQGKVVA